MDIGLEKRNEVLEIALLVENMTSKHLAKLLGIKKYENSKTLGNKSSSLSFNQKIDLLIDINALSNEEKRKFDAFMKIRNQFMHNLYAKNYESCISYLEGTENFLLKNYPQLSDLTKEDKLRNAALSLSYEVKSLTVNIIKKVDEKFKSEAEHIVLKNSQQAFIETIKELKTSLDDFFDSEIQKSKTFNSKRLKGFGTGLSKNIIDIWAKKFQEISRREKS